MDTKTKNIYMTLVFALFFVPFFSSTIFAAEVTVNFSYAKPPFVFALSESDTEENRGIELQIMEEALAYRGHSMKAKYISKDNLITQLQNGTIDIAAGISASELQKNIYYSDEFVYYWNYAVTQPDDIKRISSIKDLEGRKVLAWESATKDLGLDFEKATSKMAFYKGVTNQEEQVLLFLEKNAGTLIIDWSVFSYFAKKYGYDPTKYHQYNIFGGKTGYKVGFRNAKLRNDFNEGLAHLKSSGRYNEIYNKLWTIPGKVSLTKEEQTYLEQKGALRLCFDPNWMPYEAKTKAGQIDGMASDYLDLFKHKVGFEVILHPTSSWSESLSAIQKRECDFMLLTKSTNERKAYLDFTTPYLSFPYIVATQNMQGFIDDFEKILDKRYAVVKDYAVVSDLKTRYPSLNLVEVENVSQGLQKVKNGEVFGYIDSTAVVSRAIQQEGLDLKISAKLPMGFDQAIATRNDEPLLHEILQKAVDTVTPEDKQRIENKWLAINIEHVTDYILVYQVLIGGVLLIVFILYWYDKLQKAHKKTQHALLQLKETQNKLAQLNSSLEERIEIEVEKNKQHQKMMIQQSRHAQMGEILSMIAHQWRHPLNNLSLIIQNAVYKYSVDKLHDSVISKLDIESSIQIKHMSNTIKEFRSFFQPDNERVKYNIDKSIIDAVSIIKPMLDGDNIFLDIEVPDNIFVIGFPTELGQAIVNILTNSKDALIEKKIANKSIKLSLVSINDDAVITIEDNGGGVPLEILEKIFDPYFSTKMEKNGTGLGLYMTKIIVEDHMRGKLNVANSDNGFVVEIVILQNK